MDPQAPQVGGVEALQSQDMLNNYGVSQCHAKLQELLDYTNNPAGKPERTIRDVVGEMFLVFHHRAHLQATERQSRIAQLQSEKSSLQSENSNLQSEKIELDRTQGECEIMFAGLQSAQQEAEKRCGGQAS
ncbi:Hypothetical protein SMAX5B_013632 [Scophthalmus maximus]|uniref:Uncharacterized protein n=1 Tax=Scophthalmus maximus TaxID=52904 RepID=A0A2U9C7V5_SCOMX|nr:Hypothetical protein SMAX5B_013632 [Scophthalmus maximus]